MTSQTIRQMEKVDGGIIFSEKWCEGNALRIGIIGTVAWGIGHIPTPPTMFFGDAIGGIMTLIGTLCAINEGE